MRSIALDVNTRGFRTVNGNLFTPTAWGRLMDTGFAAGLIRERSPEKLAALRRAAERAGKSVADTAKSTLADFDVWREGAHAPIIDRATWEAYRERRLANARKAPGEIVGKYAFTGLLVCDLCDCKMVSQASAKHGKHSWRCRTVIENRACKGVTLSNRKVEAAVLNWIERKAQGLESVQEEADRLAASRVARDEVASLKAEAAKLARQVENLKDMRQFGELSRDEYLTRRAGVDAEAERLAGLIRAAERRVAAGGADMLPVFVTLRDTWRDATGPERRMLLSQVLRCVRIAPGGLVTPVPAWEAELSAD
jgi:hypothetical protein